MVENCSEFQVPGSKLRYLSSSMEPGTWNREAEPGTWNCKAEPGTRNPERGTAKLNLEL
jgi:hypothetical protein